MPSSGPVPSRAAISALRGIVFGTSCSLALIAEERRRRTDIAWTIVENGRLLRSQRCYHSGGLATVRARFDAAAQVTAVASGGSGSMESVGVGMEMEMGANVGEEQNIQRDPALGGFPDLSRGMVEGWRGRTVARFENMRELEGVLGTGRVFGSGQERRVALAAEIERKQDPMKAALEKLSNNVQQPTISTRELFTSLKSAHNACRKAKVFPAKLLELSRSVQIHLISRSDAIAAGSALLLLVRDPRIDKVTLLKHHPGDTIHEILSIDDLLYMSPSARAARFKLVGEILCGINSVFRGAHRKRHTRMLDSMCRILTLDSTGEVCREFLEACGAQAGQMAVDITAHYAKYPQADGAVWKENLAKSGLDKKKPVVIRYTNPPRRCREVDELIYGMKGAIAQGKREEAVELFEKHVAAKGRRSDACLALAVQTADTLAGEALSMRTLEVLKVAKRAKYDIIEELSRGISRHFDHLESSMPVSSYGNDCMYPHAASLLSSIRPFLRDAGLLSYNHLTRACLRTRDYIGAIRLSLASIRLHGCGDLFFHPYVVSNLIFALSALREYRLLEILLELLQGTGLRADGTVRGALARARKRLFVAVESALWDKTRLAHMMALQVVDEALKRVVANRGEMAMGERETEKDEHDSGVELENESSDGESSAGGISEEALRAEIAEAENEDGARQVQAVETEHGFCSAGDVVSLLEMIVDRFDKGREVLKRREEALKDQEDIEERRREARVRREVPQVEDVAVAGVSVGA